MCIISFTVSVLIKFIPWILLFILKSFFFFSASKGTILILNWQVGAIREVVTCALNGQAGLTLKRIKTATKSHKNIETGNSKSDLREGERDSDKKISREKHV